MWFFYSESHWHNLLALFQTQMLSFVWHNRLIMTRCSFLYVWSCLFREDCVFAHRKPSHRLLFLRSEAIRRVFEKCVNSHRWKQNLPLLCVSEDSWCFSQQRKSDRNQSEQKSELIPHQFNLSYRIKLSVLVMHLMLDDIYWKFSVFTIILSAL